jgi:Mg2+ and Co2+ transporter CorA
MRVVHVLAHRTVELDAPPKALPSGGFIWIAASRDELLSAVPELQRHLHDWGCGPLVDLHVTDLLNSQLPSNFDTTSWYDLLVFRRLAAGAGSAAPFIDERHGPPASTRQALAAIDTSPVGFAVFDALLLSVHPTDCPVREFFVQRLRQLTQGNESRGAARLPTSPADLMLRMANHMVDSSLELRRLLTRQLDTLQNELLNANSRFDDWKVLLDVRNSLHLLEGTCEDQRSAIQEWIDALAEWPRESDAAARHERELLRLRSRDVLEHIERVLSHVRRLELSVEAAVQMHFSAVGHRTKNILRTLTVLTAMFLPLNLVTGFFGVNFERVPLIHSATGAWVALLGMVGIGLALGGYFWRKRYLGTRAPK